MSVKLRTHLPGWKELDPPILGDGDTGIFVTPHLHLQSVCGVSTDTNKTLLDPG